MNLKEFFNKNKKKLFLAFILLAVSSIAFRAGPFLLQQSFAPEYFSYGFPLQFILISDSMKVVFPLIGLLTLGLDSMFWYIVSLLIFAIFARYPMPKNIRKGWMDAKEFLDENVGKRFAPSRSKIILTVLLFSISSFFSASTYQTHGDTLTGPVPIGGPTLISTGYPLMYFHATREGLIFVNLILDAIFWYLVSSLAVMLFSKYSALRNAKRGRGR